ncbi:MAG: radical SAM protein [Candidatus Omnitrophica bacterium]|nr:radical SAM protein [Candidatus Omnitrophota bacterium]
MAKILLLNPNYYYDIFNQSKVRSAVSRGTTPLGLVCIAASLIKDGHGVRILDLNLTDNPDEFLQRAIKDDKPDFVGITSTTPLIKKAYHLSSLIKAIDKSITIIVGGAHPSALPEDVLKESSIDCVVQGEGDFIFSLIVKEGLSRSIPNIFYKNNGMIVSSCIHNDIIKDLDRLPFPAYELLNINRYYQPRISSRRAPLGYLETSRGCYGKCIFCNKNIHGYQMRMKSVSRVVDEMDRMLGLGFREIQIIDDLFTADMNRAYAICEEIMRRNLKFPWYPRGGIRVDRVNEKLLKIMKRAGCYRIPFGIESGSQRIIDIVGKKISLEQAQRAVTLAKKAGLETECYFMLGLPGECEDDLKKTIEFSVKLNPDYVKFAITIPLPGTRMFDDMSSRGQIKTKDWDKYNFSVSPKELYEHDSLSWKTIDKYYNISHRKFYFRLSYLLKMFFKTLANGTLLSHARAFLQTDW